MLKDRDYDVTPYIILILSLTCTSKSERVGEGVRGVVWRWMMVGEECEVARGVGFGENVDCSAERHMKDTMVTSGGEI